MFEQLPVLENGYNPCGCCPPIPSQLCSNAVIAVGFGYAALTKDGEAIWTEQGQDWDDCMTVEDAESIAKLAPDHDWRIVLYGPLRGRTYQRHGECQWMLVEVNEGFA